MSDQYDLALVLPAYKPGHEIFFIVSTLRPYFKRLIIINDGSGAQYAGIFAKLKAAHYGVELLEHAVNFGKGRALKSAFNHLLTVGPVVSGVITADCDGQHSTRDILRIAEEFHTHTPKELVLGTRKFSGKVPLRSRLGNNLTKLVFWAQTGVSLDDTQTGLRAIPFDLLSLWIKIPADRYEFEMDTLVDTCMNGRSLVSVPIETIYEEGNPSSHFNPIVDSLKIYFVLLRFGLASFCSALLDYVLFVFLCNVFNDPWAAAFGARALSVGFNFYLVWSLVFKARGNLLRKGILYLMHVTIMTTVSVFAMNSLNATYGLDLNIGKIIVESLFFLTNFVVQRALIFGDTK